MTCLVLRSVLVIIIWPCFPDQIPVLHSLKSSSLRLRSRLIAPSFDICQSSVSLHQLKYYRFQPQTMRLALCSFAALAAVASAQSITSLLAATPELSNLTSFITLYPDLAEELGKATDITILAPSNQAINSTFQNFRSDTLETEKDLIKALLTYHVLKTKVPASAFKPSPAFLPTLLTAPALTNVTGGQVVEGFTKGQSIQVVSGERQLSTVVKEVSALRKWPREHAHFSGY